MCHKKYTQCDGERSAFTADELFEGILDELDIKATPKKVDLKLPSLTSNNPNLPKLKLPKLQKI